MSNSKSAKEKEVYLKQMRYLQEQIQRCEVACEQHEKNIKKYRAMCANTEQETKDLMEYLPLELVKKEQRLVEVRGLLEQEKAVTKQELEGIDQKNKKSLQKLQGELDEVTSNLPKLEAKHAEIIKELQQQIQSRKDQLVLNQKVHEAAVKELKEEQLDPEMVARVLKETAIEKEKKVTEEFFELVKKEKDSHKMWQENLTFLVNNIPQVREQLDVLTRQKEEFDQCMMDLDQSVHEARAENIVLKKKAQRLRKMNSQLESEVKAQKIAAEDHESNMKTTRDRLSRKLAKMSATCQNLDKEMKRLKAAIEVESNRTTELKMAMKEGDIIFKHILKEPELDPQKLRRLHAILESYAPRNK